MSNLSYRAGLQVADLREAVEHFCDLPDEVIRSFVALFSPQHLSAGEDFISQGEMGSKVAFLRKGLMRSYYLTPKGEEFNKHFFIAGSFFAPLTSLVLEKPSPLYIGALEDSQLEVADYKAVEALCQNKPILNLLMRKIVELAWIGKEQRETQLVMLSASQRYDAFLEEFPDLERRIPQYHIASYLGITPVQLSRIRARNKLT